MNLFTFGDLSPATYYDIDGNEPISTAQVICIAVDPSNPRIDPNHSVLINRIFAQHTILMENVPQGTDTHPMTHEVTRHLPLETTVKGWDIQNLRLIQELKRHEIQIERLSQRIQKALDESNWSEFLPIQRTISEQFETLLNKSELKQFRKICTNPSSEDFSTSIQKMLDSIKGSFKKNVEDVHRGCFQARLKSLQNAIDAELLKEKKVIVLLSGDFVISNPFLGDPECDIEQFLSYLKSHRYVIVNPKSSPLRMINKPQIWDDPSNRHLQMSVSDCFELGTLKFRQGTELVNVLQSGGSFKRQFSPSLFSIEEVNEEQNQL